MKILSVRFQNINSLKGEHFIDFAAAPFYGSGLFSITGATGAGKTTILDAITIALYGRTPRQNHGAPITEVVTRFTSEAYSEVVFETTQGEYRARWSIRRARGKVDGKFQNPQMELVNAATNEVVESKPSETKNKIVALINLDYDQFLRSVLLAQGDFTRFLKADDKEKSALLEKVTHTWVYSRISAFVYDKAEREEKRKLEDLRLKLQGVNLMTLEELAAAEAELNRLEEDEHLHRKKLAEYSAEQQRIQRINSLSQEITRWQSESQQWRQDHAEFVEQRNLLHRHRQAMPFQGRLAEWKMMLTQLEQLKHERSALDQRLPECESNYDQLLQQQQQAVQSLTVLQTEREQLEDTIAKVLPIDADIKTVSAALDRLLLQRQQQEEQKQRHSEQLKQLQALLEQDKTTVNDITNWLEQHATDAMIGGVLSDLKSCCSRINELREAISRESKLIEEERARIATLESEIKSLDQQSETLQQQIVAHQSQLSELQSQQELLSPGKDLNTLRKDASTLQEQVFICEKQFEIARRLASGNEQISQWKLNTEKNETAKGTLEQELQLLKRDLVTAEELLEAYQQLINNDRLVASYETARQHLVDGDPCPLCGSVTHPYVAVYGSEQIDQNQEKHQRQKKRVEELRLEISRQENELARVLTGIESQRQQILHLQNELDADEQRFADHNSRLPVALDKTDLKLLERLVSKKRTDTTNLLDQIQKLDEIVLSITKIEKEINALQVMMQTVQGKLETAKSLRSSSLERIQNAEEGSIVLAHRLAEAEKEAGELLQSFKIGYEPAAIADILLQLQQRMDVFNHQRESLTQVKRQLDLREQEFKHAQQQSSKCAEDLERVSKEVAEMSQRLSSLQLSRRELFADKSVDTERARIREQLNAGSMQLEQIRQRLEKAQQIVVQTEEQIVQLQQRELSTSEQLTVITAALSGEAVNAGFADLEELKAALLPMGHAVELEQRERQLEQRKAEIAQSLRQAEASLAKERTEEAESRSIEEISELIRSAEQVHREILQQLGSKRMLLAQQEQSKEQFKSIQLAIETQEGVYRRWRRLSDLIGSADGDKFKRFAQGVTLTRLVQLANQRLIGFSDRYQLYKPPGERLELVIIDAWQAGSMRPVSTLSGGESFLVSLALALGLSDLASNRIQINSLFIDEGFGTLDAETLDVAIDALENLRSDGKLIGIISHVDALKERIGVRVHVEKLSGGVSTLKLIGPGGSI